MALALLPWERTCPRAFVPGMQHDPGAVQRLPRSVEALAAETLWAPSPLHPRRDTDPSRLLFARLLDAPVLFDACLA